jgi:hypothetical protein
MSRVATNFKVITFKFCFNKYNYDRNYLAGIYNFLDDKTDYLKLSESGSGCIKFYLNAPEHKIEKL